MKDEDRPKTLDELASFLNALPEPADIVFGPTLESLRIVQPSSAKELIVNLPHPDRNTAAKDAAENNQAPFNVPWYPMPEFYWDANSLFWNSTPPDTIPNAKKEEARQILVGDYCMKQCK